MQLHLGGHLNYFDGLHRSNLEIALVEKKKLIEILFILKIPIGEISIISINGEVVNLEEAWIQPDDYVQLYPPIGGG